MSDRYRQTGDFGEVKIYDCEVPPEGLSSLSVVNIAGWHRVNELYRIERPNGTSSGLLLLTRSGKGYVRVGARTRTATAGTVALIPPETSSAYGALPGEPWEFDWIHFSGAHAFSCVEDIVKEGNCLFALGEPTVERLLTSYRESRRKGIERALEVSEWLNGLLFRLLKLSVVPAFTSQESSLVEEMMAFLEEESRQEFSLDALVKRYHYSKEYLIRLFKNTTGMTPYHYWRMLCLKRSLAALEMGAESIEGIARACGYETVSGYSHQFKKHFGLSPTEYRSLYTNHQN